MKAAVSVLLVLTVTWLALNLCDILGCEETSSQLQGIFVLGHQVASLLPVDPTDFMDSTPAY